MMFYAMISKLETGAPVFIHVDLLS